MLLLIQMFGEELIRLLEALFLSELLFESSQLRLELAIALQ